MRLRIRFEIIVAIALAMGFIAPPAVAASANNPDGAAERPATPAHATTRVLAIRGINNLRDIGGYATNDGRTIKWRTLFRSGDMSRMAPQAQPQLSALGIQTVIDFRSDEERARSPSRWYDEAQKPEVFLLPIGGSAADWSSTLSRQLQAGDFTREEIHATFINMYRTVPLENQAEYRALFAHILASGDRPLLFHCTGGKDRTGIGAALVLSALDVPRETIMQDFLLSNDTIDVGLMSKMLAKIFSRESGNEIDPEAMEPMLTVDRVYLDTAFAAIETEYGSVDIYLRDALGLTDTQRVALKQALLD